MMCVPIVDLIYTHSSQKYVICISDQLCKSNIKHTYRYWSSM